MCTHYSQAYLHRMTVLWPWTMIYDTLYSIYIWGSVYHTWPNNCPWLVLDNVLIFLQTLSSCDKAIFILSLVLSYCVSWNSLDQLACMRVSYIYDWMQISMYFNQFWLYMSIYVVNVELSSLYNVQSQLMLPPEDTFSLEAYFILVLNINWNVFIEQWLM